MEDNFTSTFKKIGNSLRIVRKEQGLSQQELADKIPKLDRSKISDMENGKEDFLLSTLLKVCSALDTTLENILQDKNSYN